MFIDIKAIVNDNISVQEHKKGRNDYINHHNDGNGSFEMHFFFWHVLSTSKFSFIKV